MPTENYARLNISDVNNCQLGNKSDLVSSWTINFATKADIRGSLACFSQADYGVISVHEGQNLSKFKIIPQWMMPQTSAIVNRARQYLDVAFINQDLECLTVYVIMNTERFTVDKVKLKQQMLYIQLPFEFFHLASEDLQKAYQAMKTAFKKKAPVKKFLSKAVVNCMSGCISPPRVPLSKAPMNFMALPEGLAVDREGLKFFNSFLLIAPSDNDDDDEDGEAAEDEDEDEEGPSHSYSPTSSSERLAAPTVPRRSRGGLAQLSKAASSIGIGTDKATDRPPVAKRGGSSSSAPVYFQNIPLFDVIYGILNLCLTTFSPQQI